MPEVRGEGDVGGSKACDEVVFCCAYGTFSPEGTVLTGGGERDGDVGEVEKVDEGLGGFVVDVKVMDGVTVGLEEGEDAFVGGAVGRG